MLGVVPTLSRQIVAWAWEKRDLYLDPSWSDPEDGLRPSEATVTGRSRLGTLRAAGILFGHQSVVELPHKYILHVWEHTEAKVSVDIS